MGSQHANREWPWLGGIDPRSLSLGERCAAFLGYNFQLDPREIHGPRHNELILGYSHDCRRLGSFEGVDEEREPIWTGGFSTELRTDDSDSPWCAALQSGALRWSLLHGEKPAHGLRVACRELAEDARLARTLRGLDWKPTIGSVVLLGRHVVKKGKLVLEDPLLGGSGHVRAVILSDGERYYGIGGNEHDRISAGWHFYHDPLLRAFIER